MSRRPGVGVGGSTPAPPRTGAIGAGIDGISTIPVRPPGGNGIAPGAPSTTPSARPGGVNSPDVAGNPPANRPPGTEPAGLDVPGTNNPRPGANGGGIDAPGQTRPNAGGDAGAPGAAATPPRTWGQFLGGQTASAATSIGLGVGLTAATGGFGGFGGAVAGAAGQVASTALVVDGVKAVIETLTGAASEGFSQLTENPINLAIVAGVIALVVLR
jgi:hypothetical protein